MSFLFNNTNLGGELVKAGYRFTEPTESMRAMYTEAFCGLYQKKITYIGGIAYFININKYDYNLLPNIPLDGYTYDVSIQTSYNRKASVNLNLHFNPAGMTLIEVEELVEQFFSTFGCDYE